MVDDQEVLRHYVRVLERVDKKALLRGACEIRQDLDPLLSDIITCSVEEKPAFGSFNIVSFLKFTDGCKWVARLPGKAIPALWTSLEAERLVDVFHTLKYIKDHTKVPVPEVYDFHDNLDGPVGVPYVFMQQIRGKGLWELWHDKTWS